MDKVKEQQTRGRESMEIESTWKHSFHRKNQSKFQPFSTVFWRQYWRSIWRLFNWFSTSKIRLSRSKISEKKSYIFNFVLTIYWRHYVTSIWRHFDEYVHMGNPNVHTQSNWRQKVVIFWLVGQWLSFDWKLTAFLFSKQNLVVVWNFSETVCNSDYSWYLLSCKNKDHATFR